jgi:hypothetical protein
MPGRVVVRAGQLSCSCLFKSRYTRRIQRRKQQACHLQLVMIHEVDAFRWGAEFNAPGGRVRSIIHANQPLDQPEEDDRGVPFRAEVLHGSLRLGSCTPGRDVLSSPSLACLGSENLACHLRRLTRCNYPSEISVILVLDMMQLSVRNIYQPWQGKGSVLQELGFSVF